MISIYENSSSLKFYRNTFPRFPAIFIVCFCLQFIVCNSLFNNSSNASICLNVSNTDCYECRFIWIGLIFLLTQKILKIYILYPRAWKSVFLDEINDDVYISNQGNLLFECIWCSYMYVIIHECEFSNFYRDIQKRIFNKTKWRYKLLTLNISIYRNLCTTVPFQLQCISSPWNWYKRI